MLRVGVTIKQIENKHLQNFLIFWVWSFGRALPPNAPPVATGLHLTCMVSLQNADVTAKPALVLYNFLRKEVQNIGGKLLLRGC